MKAKITLNEARRLWIHAQRLDEREPFGAGPSATQSAIEHLGYVQIDTINVIERSHHHILFNRIPRYRKSDLHAAQTIDKSVLEYWTHALSYVPTRDYAYFMRAMRERGARPSRYFQSVTPGELRRVLSFIKKEGAVSIRDMEDEELVEKDHPWASRKPSKKVLQFGFYSGRLVISERIGMLKKYDLRDRHFGWESPPPAASEKDVIRYITERALRAQAFVSLDSVTHLYPKFKPAVKKYIAAKVKAGELVGLEIDGVAGPDLWIHPEALEVVTPEPPLTHILSPFDPLIIQRKRLQQIFNYEHRFEAYLPKEKRTFGYFALPVLMGEEIVASLDLKTDRAQKKLLLQQWNWVGKNKSPGRKKEIEQALGRFEKFQLS